MRPVKLAGQAAVIALLLAGSAAIAETALTADVSVNGGIATNPYSSAVSDASSATLSGTFTPRLIITSPTASVSVAGKVTRTEYAQRYNGTTDYSVHATGQKQLSPLVNLTGGVTYMSQVRNGLYPVVDPITGLPDDPDAPVIVDPSAILSYARRTNSISGNLGLGVTLSPRDTLSVNANAVRVMFPALSVSSRDYDSYGGSLSYMRSVGAETAVGIAFNLNQVNYRSGGGGAGAALGAGSSTQYAPSLVLKTQLASRLSLNASAGVTFSTSDALGGTRSQSSFSGSVGLCHIGDRARFCMVGSRRVSPTSFAGTSTVNALSATYSYKTSPRSNLGATVSYSRASALQGSSGIDYAQAGVNFSRQILERLSAVASVTYSDSYDSSAARPANYFATIGVRYRLGDF